MSDPLTLLAATAAGGIVGLGVFSFILKHTLSKHIEAIERVPEKAWFERMEAVMRALPTAERLEKHLAQGHEHANTLQKHELRIEKVESASADHEHRIRSLEGRG